MPSISLPARNQTEQTESYSVDNKQFTLEPSCAKRLANLCGQFSQNFQQLEQRLEANIKHRRNNFSVSGSVINVQAAYKILLELYTEASNGPVLPDTVHLALQQSHREGLASTQQKRPSLPTSRGHSQVNAQNSHALQNTPLKATHPEAHPEATIQTKRLLIKPRGENQQHYVRTIQDYDINFGVGPAGTGKTWLAVACAVAALEQDKVRRILLVRPAVEAGEKLGFLPGDLTQKIDPYLRPLYDALYEMLGFEAVGKLIERHVIEVAPLAYMRGRTLNDSFIILDESQNTTKAQMKMFLTRIGFGSTAVITGDLTQIDLPRGTLSGLKHGVDVLQGVDGIGLTHFDSRDVVRHALVQRIVEAYDRHEAAEDDDGQSRSNGSHNIP